MWFVGAPPLGPVGFPFCDRFGHVAGVGVDGREIVQLVCATACDIQNVVDLIGSGFAADVAKTVVTLEYPAPDVVPTRGAGPCAGRIAVGPPSHALAR